ncbi:hypothetical protein V8F20_010283 [Naviculisporaceae sp. PSN 640]
MTRRSPPPTTTLGIEPSPPTTTTTCKHEENPPPKPGLIRRSTVSQLSTSFLNSYVGLLSLIAMLLCAAASSATIALSHNAPISSWRVQPSVLLSIFSAASNVAFASALATGVAVRYWLSVSRGASLSQLHYIWEHGHSGLVGFFSGLKAGSHARKVVLLATLASTCQFITAPLLQRSTHTEVQERKSQDVLRMDLASEIPDGWMGNIDANRLVIGFRRGMVQTQRWWKNETMLTRNETGYRCEGDSEAGSERAATCVGYVKGFGLAHSCWTEDYGLDLGTSETDYSPVLLINTTRPDNGTEQQPKPYLRLKTEYLSHIDGDCMGTITREICDLEAGVVEYPVTVQEGTVISLRREELTKMRVLKKTASHGDSMSAKEGDGAGPLAGINSFAISYLQENATKRTNKILNRTLYWGPGLMADIFFTPNVGSFYNNTGEGGDGVTVDPIARCRLNFSSPTEYILNTLHEWTFRAALNIGNSTRDMDNRTSDQVFEVQRTVPAVVYRADMRYLGASIATTVLCLGFVGSLMWGWWRLKRKVTLSPIETANAFGAPILTRHQVEPDAGVDQILQRARDVELRVTGATV